MTEEAGMALHCCQPHVLIVLLICATTEMSQSLQPFYQLVPVVSRREKLVSNYRIDSRVCYKSLKKRNKVVNRCTVYNKPTLDMFSLTFLFSFYKKKNMRETTGSSSQNKISLA